MRRQKTLLKTPLFRALFSSVFVFAVALVIRLIWSINMQNGTGMAFVDNLPDALNIPKSILLNGLAALIFIAAGLALLLSSLANYFERKK